MAEPFGRQFAAALLRTSPSMRPPEVRYAALRRFADQLTAALFRRSPSLRPGWPYQGSDSAALPGSEATRNGRSRNMATDTEDAREITRRLTEEFILTYLPSQEEAFHRRWPVLSELPVAELAAIGPAREDSPGLGYARPDEVDSIAGLVAWSVLGWSSLRSARRRIQRESDRRRLRPEVSDALARYLSARLGDELAGHD